MHESLEIDRIIRERNVQTDQDVLRATLEQVRGRLPFNRTYLSDGIVAPSAGATITGTPRIVMCVEGRNDMWIARGERAERVILEPMDAVYISTRSWNHPVHTYAHGFVTLDYTPSWLRYYRGQHSGGGKEGRGDNFIHIRHGSVPAVITATTTTIEEALALDCVDSVLPELVLVLTKLTTDLLFQADRRVSSSSVAWQKACQYIEESIGGELSRAQVATAAGVHPNHLSRIFRDQGHDSFSKYVTRRRMSLAAMLLRQYQMPIKEIAAECGYCELTYFHQVFKRFYGISPAAYRSQGNRSR